jgi:predicted GH43/DUF377 family glycosyl hydrolase
MFKLLRTEGAILQPIPEHPWESGAVFNPAVIGDTDAVHMLYRAVEGENFSTIGYARLDKNGRVLSRHPEPLITREHEFEKQGVEDPRIARIDDRYYIVYTGYDAATCRVCMASTSDFMHIRKHGVIIPDIWDKDAMLFPELVNGKLILMHRIEPNIQLAQFDGIDHLLGATAAYWEAHFAHLDVHTIMRPLYTWEAEKIGGGAPPIKTNEGWLVIYHGVDRKSVYRAGAALLELDNPFRVIARLPQPILEPEQDYEKRGDVPNVVFPEGALVDGDRLMVFYGGADKVIGLAVADLNELLHELKKHKV